jgi:hypothetical protein
MTDWTPQETLALIGPVFDLSLEECLDGIVIVTDREGMVYHAYAIADNTVKHPSPRERACRLLYIQSLLQSALVDVGKQLHEEIHK